MANNVELKVVKGRGMANKNFCGEKEEIENGEADGEMSVRECYLC